MANPGWAFAMKGAGTEVLELDIYDDIGDPFWGDAVSAKDVRAALKGSPNAKTIKLRVNSRGGEVFDGFAIYNMLVEHPARVEAQVDALAASMASVVIMAADEITVSQGAMIMIHNPWVFVMGESEDLRQTADLLDKMRDQCADVYVARTGISREKAIEMMDAETWMTADEAKANGFADKVIPAKKAAQTKAMASVCLDGLKAPSAVVAAFAQARNVAPHLNHGGTEPTQENGMDKEKRAKICAALGLSPDVSDDVIVQASESMRAAHGKAPEGFELTPKGEFAALQARVSTAEAELASSRKAARDVAVASTIDEAVKAGKIIPAAKDKYTALCATDAGFETVKDLIATLTPSPLLAKQGQEGVPPNANVGGKRMTLTAEEKAHCAKHGLKEELYLAAINEER